MTGEFSQLSQAWYNWGLDKPSPKLEICSDSWEHLAKHPELFAKLAQHPGIQPGEFCQFLKERDFRDVVPRQVPNLPIRERR